MNNQQIIDFKKQYLYKKQALTAGVVINKDNSKQFISWMAVLVVSLFTTLTFWQLNGALADCDSPISTPISTSPCTTTPISSPTTITLSSNQTQASLINATGDSVIHIPNTVSAPTLNLGIGGISATTKTATLSYKADVYANTNLGTISLEMPALTAIIGSLNWDGVINIPQLLANSTVTAIASNGYKGTISSVIEVGAGDEYLTLSSPVRLVIPGQAGKLPAFVKNGVFTRIVNLCSADAVSSGANFPEGGECYLDVGADLVIWTEHFTKFVTYTETKEESGSSVSGSTSASNSNTSCVDAKPGTPVITSVVPNGKNSVTISWTAPTGSVTSYLLAYGNKSGQLLYGNPNIGNVRSFTVNYLNASQAYFFRIKALNNCSVSEYSNEFSAKADGLVINTPAQGFKQGVLAISKLSENVKQNNIEPVVGPKEAQESKQSGNIFQTVRKFFASILAIFKKSS